MTPKEKELQILKNIQEAFIDSKVGFFRLKELKEMSVERLVDLIVFHEMPMPFSKPTTNANNQSEVKEKVVVLELTGNEVNEPPTDVQIHFYDLAALAKSAIEEGTDIDTKFWNYAFVAEPLKKYRLLSAVDFGMENKIERY